MNVIQERMRLTSEWSKQEQFICPGNPNHKLISLDRLKCHLYTCRELKTRALQTTVYLCQFYEAHMFLDQAKKNDHEINCKWRQLPGQSPYDPSVNKSLNIKGEVKNQQQQQQSSQSQEGHYEYALRRGLIKKKNYQQDINITKDDFVFVRDPGRINLELEQKFNMYLQNYDLHQLMILIDERDDDEFLEQEFPKQNYQIEMIALSEWISECFHLGLPFNEHYLINHTISLAERNNHQRTLRTMFHRSTKIGMHRFVPLKLFDEIAKIMEINTYEKYLIYLFEEVKLRYASNKYQEEFMLLIKYTAENHTQFQSQSCIVNTEIEGEILFLVPRQSSKLLQTYAFRQTDLVIMCFKTTQNKIAELINPYLQEQNKIQVGMQDYSQQKHVFQWKTVIPASQKVESMNQETKSIIESQQDQEDINNFIEQQKIQTQIDEVNQQSSDYIIRSQVNNQILQNQKIKNIEIQKQNEELAQKQHILSTQQQEQDEFFKTEYKRLKKRIREYQEYHFNKIQKEFDEFQQDLLKDVQDKIKDSKTLEDQYNQLMIKLNKKKDDFERLEAKFNKFMEEQGKNQLEQTQYYDIQDAQFMVSQRMLCKACGNNRANVMYKPCYHSVCSEELLREGINQCLYCQQKFVKIYYILWENGFKLNYQDYVIKI